MDEIVANAARQQRVSAFLITSFALGALLLAAMGLFGVISGSVTRRAHAVNEKKLPASLRLRGETWKHS